LRVLTGRRSSSEKLHNGEVMEVIKVMR